MNLTDFFSGRSAESLEIEPRSWYASRNIDLRTGTRVHRIDRANQCVQTTTGESFPYDRLVLATGSRPFVPPIPGATQDGVFVYRTIEDLQAIEARGADARTAAVLGGGLLGLEAAKALRNMGLIPHVVEMAPGLMPRQLNREGSELLRQRIERMGVHVHLTKRTQSIEKHGDFLIVKFDTGDSLAVDMVVVSAGIRPRDELADQAGLKLGDRGGISVNDQLLDQRPEHLRHRGMRVASRKVVWPDCPLLSDGEVSGRTPARRRCEFPRR